MAFFCMHIKLAVALVLLIQHTFDDDPAMFYQLFEKLYVYHDGLQAL